MTIHTATIPLTEAMLFCKEFHYFLVPTKLILIAIKWNKWLPVMAWLLSGWVPEKKLSNAGHTNFNISVYFSLPLELTNWLPSITLDLNVMVFNQSQADIWALTRQLSFQSSSLRWCQGHLWFNPWTICGVLCFTGDTKTRIMYYSCIQGVHSLVGHKKWHVKKF